MNGSEHFEVAAGKDIHQVVLMEVDLNTLNLDDKEDDVGDTKDQGVANVNFVNSNVVLALSARRW